MRAQDFLGDYLKDLKFRVSYPNELVTTQEAVDDFAIEFGQWLLNQPYRVRYNDKKELLEIYKKTL